MNFFFNLGILDKEEQTEGILNIKTDILTEVGKVC